MTDRPSNARFVRFCENLRDQLGEYAWVAFAWIIAMINEHLLPANRSLDARAIADWCAAFMEAHDAGENQYRGLPVDPAFAAAMDRPGNLENFVYRGVKVSVVPQVRPAYLLGTGTAVPFVPTYQLQLRKWILQHQMTDKDMVAVVPEMQSSFRGRDI
ncbi:MAG: hypothetical protein AAF268_12825 [Cyanobacteria bacterium P01_A01_bin.3]